MPEPMNKDTAVRNLQRYLRRLSYEDNNILPIPIDGIFASRTEEALSEFQRMRSLPVTGRADKVTWDALFREYRALQETQDLHYKPDFFPSSPADYVTQQGEKHAFISLLQFMLNELRVVYDSLPPLNLSGVMDIQTSRSVSEFQRINALPITGQVNRATWNRIAEEYTHFVT